MFELRFGNVDLHVYITERFSHISASASAVLRSDVYSACRLISTLILPVLRAVIHPVDSLSFRESFPGSQDPLPSDLRRTSIYCSWRRSPPRLSPYPRRNNTISLVETIPNFRDSAIASIVDQYTASGIKFVFKGEYPLAEASPEGPCFPRILS